MFINRNILEYRLVAQEHSVAGRSGNIAPVSAVTSFYATKVAGVNLLGDADICKFISTMLCRVVKFVFAVQMVAAHHRTAGEKMHASATCFRSRTLVVCNTHIWTLRLVCHSREVVRFLCIKTVALNIGVGNHVDCEPAVGSLVEAVAAHINHDRVTVGHSLVNFRLGVFYLEILGYLLEHVVVRSKDKLTVSDRFVGRLDVGDVLYTEQALEGGVAQMHQSGVASVCELVYLLYGTVVFARFELVVLGADLIAVGCKELYKSRFRAFLGHYDSELCILCVTVDRHVEFCLQLSCGALRKSKNRRQKRNQD